MRTDYLISNGVKRCVLSALLLAGATGFGFAMPRGHGANTPGTTKENRADVNSKSPASSRIPDFDAVLPLSFEENEGQTDPSVRFVAHGHGYSLFLTANQAVVELQQQEPQSPSPQLQKMKPSKRKLVESRKSYRGSPRYRKALKTQTVRVTPVNANPKATIEALDELPGKTNYFVGNDPEKWHSGVSTFARVRYSEIYPGVDLIYYGNRKQLEFDFVVAAHADPGAIALNIDTNGEVRISKAGDLVVSSDGPLFRLIKPAVYQLVAGERTSVPGKFVLRGSHEVGIVVGAYDRSLPLLIDPTLAYSTYLGGNGFDDGFGIAVDASGCAYLVGQTTSTNFPTANSYSTSSNAAGIAFVSKLDPTGTTLMYSTYLGGTGGEVGNGIALDPTGNVYVTGYTLSTDFPIVNGFQTSTGTTNANAFVARIDTTQSGSASLVYSTYIGGGGNSTNPIGDVGFAIAADAAGLAYVTGQTTSDNSVSPFPTTSTAFQSSLNSSSGNAFLTVIDTGQSGATSLVYSTYLGGSSSGVGDYGLAVATDGRGNAFLTGTTTSTGAGAFPTTSTAYQNVPNSTYGTAFVTQISSTQSGSDSLLYSTLLGGSGNALDAAGEEGQSIVLDSQGSVYVSGNTSSTDFPVTTGAYQTSNPADRAFVAKLDPTQSGVASLIYSTYLGGSGGDEGRGIAVDSSGNAFIGGATASSDFPTTSGAYQNSLNSPYSNGFVAELNSGATALIYSTYLGGSCADGDVGNGLALDSIGNPYLVGDTCSSDFPIFPTGAYQASLGGSQNAFVSKLAIHSDPQISAVASQIPNSAGWNNLAVTVSFTCLPGAAPITSCTAPITISSEGANQTAAGNAVDSASNTASASDTVSFDMTAPVVTVTGPTSGSSVATPYVVVTGTITDALSGVGAVYCGSVAAQVSSGTFSCTVQLSSPSNTILITGYDLAGNSATASTTVSVSMSTPTSLTVSPANPNMIVSASQSFIAVDQSGTPRPDATWSISNPSIVSFSTASPNTVVANAVGTATLTATVGTLTGSTTVTVMSGSTLAPGTVLWSATLPSGFGTQQIVPAVPTANGPDLYAINTDSSGNVMVQALTSDGRALWSVPVSGVTLTGHSFGDGNGGLILRAQDSTAGSDELINLAGPTGAQNWQYSTSFGILSDTALGLDGNLYLVAGSSSGTSYLTQISASSGATGSQFALPTTSYSIFNDDCFPDDNRFSSGAGQNGSPIVAADGSVYLEVESSQSTHTYVCPPFPDPETQVFTYSESVALLHVTPSGGTTTLSLNSFSTSDGSSPINLPGDIIPDGKGGVIASWTEYGPGSSPYTTPVTVADISSSGTTTTNLTNVIGGASLVLGDQGSAFATDGTDVVSFDVNSLVQNWSYTSTGGALTLVAATPGGGVTVNDSTNGAVSFNSSGSPTTPIAGLQGALQTWGGDWFNLSPAPVTQHVSGAQGGLPSGWTVSRGNPSLSRQSAKEETIVLRSFAPWYVFGPDPANSCPADCFYGDNRSFSDAIGIVTSRTNFWGTFTVPQLIFVKSDKYSDESRSVAGLHTYGSPTDFTSHFGNHLHVALAGSNPLVPGSPTIDTKLDVEVSYALKAVCFSGEMYGDGFPNSEALIVNDFDPTVPTVGTSLVRFATPFDRNLGPLLALPGDNSRPMGKFSNVCILN